jgi:hypothetical protein
MVARFVNASTADGFNPYRIERDGIDWEVLDPREPWGHIGYWGDHQIVYLLRLLEATARSAPGTLAGLLGEEIFCYADVPYRIAPYADVVADPRETIRFDTALAARIAERVAAGGTDGKLLRDRAGALHHAGLLEKLLVPALSKLSNLVPDGGIWMNTQRPEWNDANNALAGHGVSMVTLSTCGATCASSSGCSSRWARRRRRSHARSLPGSAACTACCSSTARRRAPTTSARAAA